MRNLFATLVVCISTYCGFSEEPTKLDSSPVVGNWLGTLKVGPIDLRIAFRVTIDKDGKLNALMDSLDQNAVGIPVETVRVENKQVTFKLPKLNVEYVGEFQADQQAIIGHFIQGAKLPLELRKVAKIPSLARPQEPKKPYPYEETEVTFPSKAAGVTLAGTLTQPKGDGPFVTVVLITGSGPQDRDESIFGHKPFWILADHLTRNGIAVLRFDDRGVAKSTGNHATATTADFAEDVAGAVQFLSTNKKVGKIGLVGHSEGGIIAPIVAVADPKIAFIVLLAGPAFSGKEILFKQGADIIKAAGGSEADLKMAKDLQTKIFEMVERDADTKDIMKEAEDFVGTLPEKDRKLFLEQGGMNNLRQITTPWFRAFIKYDPRPTLQKVKCPVLALVGELDIQVNPKTNIPELEKTLKASGNADYTVKELPKLNHIFQTAKTGQVNEYGQLDETISPLALQTIKDWILKRK